ncbi:MAG: ankyrin repeat domain-containing protein [Bdellovibrionales bacterium]
MSGKRTSDYFFGTLFVLSVAMFTAVVYEPTIEESYSDFARIEHTERPGEPFNLLHVANFVYAAEQGEIATVERYLNMGMDPNAQDHNKDTALMGASLNGHRKIVKLLLEHQANPLIKNESGYSSIDFARIYGDDNLSAFLVQASGQEEKFRSISSVDDLN